MERSGLSATSLCKTQCITFAVLTTTHLPPAVLVGCWLPASARAPLNTTRCSAEEKWEKHSNSTAVGSRVRKGSSPLTQRAPQQFGRFPSCAEGRWSCLCTAPRPKGLCVMQLGRRRKSSVHRYAAVSLTEMCHRSFSMEPVSSHSHNTACS